MWECFQATFLLLGQFGFVMLVYGAQRTQKHSGTVLLNIVVGLASSFLGFLILGRYLVSGEYGGLIGNSSMLKEQNSTNTWQVTLML